MVWAPVLVLLIALAGQDQPDAQSQAKKRSTVSDRHADSLPGHGEAAVRGAPSPTPLKKANAASPARAAAKQASAAAPGPVLAKKASPASPATTKAGRRTRRPRQDAGRDEKAPEPVSSCPRAECRVTATSRGPTQSPTGATCPRGGRRRFSACTPGASSSSSSSIVREA